MVFDEKLNGKRERFFSIKFKKIKLVPTVVFFKIQPCTITEIGYIPLFLIYFSKFNAWNYDGLIK